MASYWQLDWPANQGSAISQTWSGYGRLGNGFFCNLACGYRFAVELMNRVEEGRNGKIKAD